MARPDDCQLKIDHDLIRSLKDPAVASRPILTHLNGDTSWLLQIPYPLDAVKAPAGRERFNILIDPWFTGTQTDFFSWFSRQWHVIPSSVQNMDELEQYLRDFQTSSHAGGPSLKSEDNVADLPKSTPNGQREVTQIDAVIISHEFTDHCHEATLLQLPRSVPLFATSKAATRIRSWRHFNIVTDIPTFDGSDWHKSSIAPLPQWLGVTRILTPTRLPNPAKLHSALGIFIARSEDSSATAEAVIYTPHGIDVSSFRSLTRVSPSISILALLHGLTDVSLSFMSQLNLGAHNAIKAQDVLRARYWVSTHDENKEGSGIVAFLLRRKEISLTEAMKTHGEMQSDDFKCIDIPSGRSQVLA